MSIEGVRGGTASGRRRYAALLVAGVLLPLPVLTGCETSGSETRASAVPQDIAPAARTRVRDGGTVRWAIDSMPLTLNTFQADADTTGDRIAEAVLPALFTLDERGRPQRNEDYLDAADVIEREPRQVVRYTIDRAARWSDGRAVGVRDFIAQWKALSGKDRAYWTARNAGYDRIQKVEEGESPREVLVTFARPYTDWRSLFTPLYPRGVMGSPDAFNDGARTTLKATAGPYLLKKVHGSKGNQRKGTVTLERNPKWWGDRPKLDRLVFTVVPRARRAAALAAGRLDIAEIDAATAERISEAGGKPKDVQKITQAEKAHQAKRAEQTEKRSTAEPGKKAEKGRDTEREERREMGAPAASPLRGYTVRTSLEPAYTQLALNGASGPLADERVRRAVARTIDRQAIADAVLKPMALPAQPLGSHLMMAGQQGYEDNSAALGRQDAEAAQALLSSAGWRRSGGGLAGEKGSEKGEKGSEKGEKGIARGGSKASAADVRVLHKNGKPLTLRFVLPTGHGTEPIRMVGDRISRMLAKIGIRTRITTVADASYFKDHIASGDYDLALWSWPVSAYPATDARPIFAKPRPAPDGSLLVEQNYTRVGTDHIDQLFDQAVTELDAAASRALVRRADARIWAAAGSIPLYQRPQLVATKSNLANVGAFGFATPRYENIGFRR
ncbi:ABC transporter substrate-binding protein [Streptomyces sp. KR80]|uniref:ABC transporter substrate-binding protein n=1 Tax=Streptomyces sp. KR80 TaxID=3457426 RepID=UPI003FD237CD